MSRGLRLSGQRPRIFGTRRRRSSSRTCRSRCTAAASRQRGATDDFLSGYPARREGLAQHRRAAHQPGGDARPRPLRALHGRRTQGVRLRLLGARPHPSPRRSSRAIPGSSIPAICRAARPRETGAKGAMRVTVEDGRIVSVEPVALRRGALGASSSSTSPAPTTMTQALVARARRAGARLWRRRGGDPSPCG